MRRWHYNDVLQQPDLDRLDAAWRAQGAPTSGSLAPGLIEAELDAYAAELGFDLPGDLRVWWGRHNGAVDGVSSPGAAVGVTWYLMSLLEVLGLRLEDISYGRRRIVVRHRTDHPAGVRQKSRRDRTVDLLEGRALPAVSDYVMHERPADADTGYVFLVGGRGQRRLEALSYDGLVRMFARAARRAGVRDAWLTPHALRHTHATRMFEGGMRDMTLMTRLGHASPDSTKIYTRVSDPDVIKDYRAAIGDTAP
jgi:integrase